MTGGGRLNSLLLSSASSSATESSMSALRAGDGVLGSVKIAELDNDDDMLDCEELRFMSLLLPPRAPALLAPLSRASSPEDPPLVGRHSLRLDERLRTLAVDVEGSGCDTWRPVARCGEVVVVAASCAWSSCRAGVDREVRA